MPTAVKEFHIRQKFKLASDSFSITLNGGKVYEVKGNPWKFGSQAHFLDLAGNELASLKQTNSTKLKPWKDFVWYKDGKEWATANQKDWGALSKKEISIDIPGENDYKIVGDRMSWKFDVFKGSVLVAEINKKWGITDNYGVQVFTEAEEAGASEIDILLCGILVDQVYHDNDDHK